jgi:hypothetical protein
VAKHFDGHGTGRGVLPGLVHLAHAPFGDQADERHSVEACSWGERHRGRHTTISPAAETKIVIGSRKFSAARVRALRKDRRS